MERGTTPTVAGVAVGDRNDSVRESEAIRSRARSRRRARRALPSHVAAPIDAHDEPVAAALDRRTAHVNSSVSSSLNQTP